MSETQLSLPSDFVNVLSKLNKLNEQGSSLSQRASGLNRIASESVEGLRIIYGKVKDINELVNRLKSSLARLSNLNEKLTSELESAKSGFKEEISNLESSQRAELASEKARSEAELAEIKSSLSQMSEEDKQRALEAAREASTQQQEAISAAHEEERGKMVLEYQDLNSRLLSELERIATNQAEVIASLDAALMGDQQQETLTGSLVEIQNNIVRLLDDIHGELSNERYEDSRSASLEQAVNMPEAPQGQLLQEEPQQEIPRDLFAPEIDLNSIEQSQEVPENAPGIDSENKDELFQYMLKILAARRRGMGLRSSQRYDEDIKPEFNQWMNLSTNSNPNIASLSRQKNKLYGFVNSIFNETNDISPKSPTIELHQFGGRRTRRKYKRVHFKTRGKKGGKNGGKRGGKKGGKSRKGGKKGGKRTRKN